MVCLVPLRIQRRVFQPEVRTKIEDATHFLVEISDNWLACHVGKAKEHCVEAFKQGRLVFRICHVPKIGGEAWVKGTYFGSSLGVAACGSELHVRVGSDETHEFSTGEARCANDPDPKFSVACHGDQGTGTNTKCIIIHINEYLCTSVFI